MESAIMGLNNQNDGQAIQAESDELDYLSSASLQRRKDFLDRDEEAKSAPNRVLYFRRNADNARLIHACTVKLRADPKNVRALLIRASSYMKVGKHDRPKLTHATLLALCIFNTSS